jgi:ribosome-associated protein
VVFTGCRVARLVDVLDGEIDEPMRWHARLASGSRPCVARLHAMPREIAIRGATIRLGQLLKLAGLIDTGSAVKELLATETVTVNSERETRRGRQLHPGDCVRVGERELRVIAAPAPAQPA